MNQNTVSATTNFIDSAQDRLNTLELRADEITNSISKLSEHLEILEKGD